jgi:hypothetical protein
MEYERKIPLFVINPQGSEKLLNDFLFSNNVNLRNAKNFVHTSSAGK